MNGIEITTTLTQADWRAYQMAYTLRLQRLSNAEGGQRAKLFAIVFAVSVGLALALAFMASDLGERMPFVGLIVGAALSLATLAFARRRLQAHAMPNADGTILGRSSISFLADCVRLQKQGAHAEYTWTTVEEVSLTTEHAFVWIDRIAGIIVPLRDLPADLTPQALVEQIRATAASAGRPLSAPSPVPLAVSRSPDATTPPPSFKDFVRAAFKLLTLRTTDVGALALSDRAAASILIGSLGLMIGVDWILADAGSLFSPFGLVVSSWYAMLALIAAWLSSRLSEPRVEIRQLVTIMIALTPAAIVIRLLCEYFLDGVWLAATTLTALYAALVLERSLRSLTLRPQPRAIAAVLAVICVAAFVNERFYMSAEFWYPSYDEYEANAESTSANLLAQWRASEKTLFEQAERIQTAVDQIERPAALDAAAFFVGFAGMGEQRVFAGEIDLADRVIAQKFATTGRAIRLVNDRRDLDAHPLASPTALRYTLNGLAQKMDRERDVLFLALSSHGSDDASLSVSNANLPLNDLTAAELADALRESGIKWRVIIVSACYAGTFIEPLRDDYTIVIAAAAADRTSFGCSDDRDLTYFGEAFYRDSLPTAANLRGAFENAKRLIGEREKAEDKTASNPEAHFGTAIERHLEDRPAPRLSDTESVARPQL